MFLWSNRKIQNIPHIQVFLADEVRAQDKLAIGWGRKSSFQKALTLAKQHNIRSLCVEDGFVRSLGLGKQGASPLSLVVDHSGIYFDATQTSDLEQLILKDESEHLNARAQQSIATLLKHQITKYNQKFVPIDANIFASGQHILIVDQTFADQSIAYAGASAAHFQQMLQQAQHDYPHATLWVKTHPDVIAGTAKGHFSPQDFDRPNVKVIAENYNPIAMLQFMHAVYVVSSQLGFEALLCGKKVYCFGLPWYAGWGQTDDRHAPVELLQGRRHKYRSLAHLFASAYLLYARYVLPSSGKRCELEDILALLIPNIEFQKNLSSSLQLYAFSRWKRTFLRAFLGFPNVQMDFKNYRKPKKNQWVVAWGKKAHRLKQQGYPQVYTVEDGFIRSIGLGANLIRPCSLVFDPIGIYYDATQASRLENLLNHCQLNPQQVLRAEQLRQKIIELNISKYNVGEKHQLNLPKHLGKTILVIGQVEDDMSIQLGCIDIKTNLALLQEVRLQNPQAYIVYKPHPDVQAGLRAGGISRDVVLNFADQMESSLSIVACFPVIDELHTLTSLSGFEALIRNIKVVCYGIPFYSGWGLTQDRHQQPRRLKKLSLHELIYSVLVDYPTYSLSTNCINSIPLTTVESVIEYIEQQSKLTAQNKNQNQKKWVKFILGLKRLSVRK